MKVGINFEIFVLSAIPAAIIFSMLIEVLIK